jgi:CBS domain-containing protein
MTGYPTAFHPRSQRERKVGEVMTEHVIHVGADNHVHAARALAHQRGVHHLLVTDGKELLGVLGRHELAGAPGSDLVSDWMSVPVFTIAHDATLAEAALIMAEAGVSCLPVRKGEVVVGILSRSDLESLGLLEPDDVSVRQHGA